MSDEKAPIQYLRDILSQNLNSNEDYLLLSFNKNMTPSLDIGVLDQLDLHISFCKKENPSNTHLNLFIDCPGGDGTIVPHLVEKLRFHFLSYKVFVLEQATSAATMIAYGADEIYLSPNAFLGPVDPILFIDIGRGSIPVEANRIIATYQYPPPNQSIVSGILCWSPSEYQRALLSLFDAEQDMKTIASLSKKSGQDNIINHLVRGYNSHYHKIFITEAKSIGLSISKNSSAIDIQCLQIKQCLISKFNFDQFVVFKPGINENIGAIMVSRGGVSVIKHVVTQPNNIDPHFTRWEFSKI